MENENTVIKLIDSNADGCGTDVHTMVEVYGKLTHDDIKTINKIINDYKKDNEEWQTDNIIDVICDYITQPGYQYNYTLCSYETDIYDYEIEF